MCAFWLSEIPEIPVDFQQFNSELLFNWQMFITLYLVIFFSGWLSAEVIEPWSHDLLVMAKASEIVKSAQFLARKEDYEELTLGHTSYLLSVL